MAHELIDPIRKQLFDMKMAAELGVLTPTRLDVTLGRIATALDQVEQALEGEPAFELTDAGKLAVLGLREGVSVRIKGHLGVIDGGQS